MPAGVSLVVNGVATHDNSLVYIDDILYTTNRNQAHTNSRPTQHDSTLLCVTDLVDCCETQGLGNWYFPDGTVVPVNDGHGFQSNRGNNENLRVIRPSHSNKMAIIPAHADAIAKSSDRYIIIATVSLAIIIDPY